MMSLRATLLSIAVSRIGSRRPPPFGAGPAGRLPETSVPVSTARGSFWRLRRWLGIAIEQGVSKAFSRENFFHPSSTLLLAVRREFSDSLADIPTAPALALSRRIQAARSLRELWHLRVEVFGLVSRFHSQTEADRRLALLNRHFPTRSPRSGFGPL